MRIKEKKFAIKSRQKINIDIINYIIQKNKKI